MPIVRSDINIPANVVYVPFRILIIGCESAMWVRDVFCNAARTSSLVLS